MTRRAWTASEDERLMALAWREAFRHMLRFIPAHRRQDALDEAMAVAMGIVGGCCGPNGDFSRDYDPKRPGVPLKDKA